MTKKMTIGGTRSIGGTSSIVTKVKYAIQQLWLQLFTLLSDIVKYRRHANQSQSQSNTTAGSSSSSSSNNNNNNNSGSDSAIRTNHKSKGHHKKNHSQQHHQQQQQQQQLHHQHQHHQKGKIPEVKGLPLVGTLFDLIAAGGAPKLHLYIDKRHQQYGDIFRERLGGTQDAIFVSSANLMRSVFLHEGSYPRHPLPDAWTLYNQHHKCERGLFFMEGEEWYHNRRLLSRILLTGNLNWMDWHIRQCTNKMIANWKSDLAEAEQSTTGCDYVVVENLEQKLYRWSIDVIISVMFGSASYVENDHLNQVVGEFSQIVQKIFECSSLLMNFPPKLAKKLNLKMWSDFEKCVDQTLVKGYQIIDMYLELSAAYPDGLYEKLKDTGTSLELIKRLFVDLVIAAGDTTAFSTIWALYLLSQNEQLQQKICEESSPHCHDTPLVRGLIKETLRLYPVAPFIGRYLPKDSKIGKYHIKKDSLVLLSLYTSGRDSKHFPEPLKVLPERWLRDEHTGEYRGVHEPHASLPFAIGNRSCIGRKLALYQMQYLITEMSKHFRMRCDNPTPIEGILRLVTVPNQALLLHLYTRVSS